MSWQYSELKKFLEDNTEDPLLNSKTIFLVNPEERKQIDEIIYKNLWPAVIKGVGTTSIWIKATEFTFPRSKPEDEKSPYTKRSLTFLLEDPRKPLSDMSNVSWYCRGKIEASLSDYMVSFDFYIYLPINFSLNKIMRLLKNDNFAGMPPDLSYEKSHFGDEIFVLSFSKGHGAGWGLENYETAANRIREDIRLNIDIIAAIYMLQEDPKNTKKFNMLEKALVRAFGNN